MGVLTGLEVAEVPSGLTASPSGPNSVVQVAALKGLGSAAVSFVRGTTGHFDDSSSDLPARFANGESVNTGAPSPEGAAAISLSHNFGLYLITDDGTRILECKSSSSSIPFFTLFQPGPALLARYILAGYRSSLLVQSINTAVDGWSNASPDTFRFQGTVV